MQFSSSLPYLNGFYGGGECSTLCSPGKAHYVSKLAGFVMEFTPNSMLLWERVKVRRVVPTCLRGWKSHPFDCSMLHSKDVVVNYCRELFGAMVCDLVFGEIRDTCF